MREHIETVRRQFDEQIIARYRQLELREQRLLLFAAVALPLLFVVFGLLLPMQDRHRALQAGLQQAQAAAAEAERLADYLKEHAGQAGKPDAGGNLLTRVERIARQSGVRRYMTRIKSNQSPDGREQLMIRMKDAPFDATLRFTHALAVQKLALDALTLRSADAPGRVSVRAVISGD